MGLPAPSLNSLLTILGSAPRVISLKQKLDHVTSAQILALNPHFPQNKNQGPHKALKALPSLAPNYLSDLLPSPLCLHKLLQPHWFPCYSVNRSQAHSILRPFALPGPSTWNSLPLTCHHSPFTISISVFKSCLLNEASPSPPSQHCTALPARTHPSTSNPPAVLSLFFHGTYHFGRNFLICDAC